MTVKERITPDFIFESSWEVCNKVGGIYTVLSTRAKTLQDIFPDHIVFIGPDIWEESANSDFIEDKSLFKDWKKQAKKNNLKVRIGRWNVPGRPITVLVDFSAYYPQKDALYYRMWERFGVESIAAYGDYDESCLFAYSVGLVVESLYHYLHLEDKKVIAHFNEWMLGMGVLYLKDTVPAVASVFTTHATSIGRSICGNGKPLYGQFTQYNGDQMARELNMEAKHSLEKQAAHHADCFTTVSALTAKECAQLLDKAPDVVTPNGFESDFVPQGKVGSAKRAAARRALLNAARQLTGETLPDDAFLVSISGRYEYKNKGIDVFIEAINRVRHANPNRAVVAFILVPAWICGARPDLQKRLMKNETPACPLSHPYCTHLLNEPENDKVCEYLNYLSFHNQKDYNTKIIFVPSYLNGNDGIFNLPYYDLLIGLDLTVFPSYYEPWGYTPLESIAFGVPTITTTLAGFGLWAQEICAEKTAFQSGVQVIERTDDNYFEVAEEIKNSILQYLNLSEEQVAKCRTAAQKLSKEAAWKKFIAYYLESYDMALQR